MRILHAFRTPVGGLFRYVRDLARGQAEAGHQCGIVCDSTTGGEGAAKLLAGSKRHCALGIARIPISRLPGFGDLAAARQVAEVARQWRPDIVHCHGAKGGLYGRLAARRLRIPSVYTPHGGSLHFQWASPSGAAFLAGERLMRGLGSGFVFVCNFERDVFAAKIGLGGKPYRVIYNGLWPEEFVPVAPAADAADVVYLGELRKLKGTDVLIDALRLVKEHRPISAVIVGEGEDRAAFEAQAAAAGLGKGVHFLGAMPARKAFSLGRIYVLPSRAESFPYAVLEAIAAGKPIVASRVGGVFEMLPPDRLVEPGSPAALARAIEVTVNRFELAQDEARRQAAAARDRFGAERMCAEVLDFYRSIMAT
jgi:glycosyltransferase involved in cell wall biosynthesis